jgi:hypothetical protein
MYYDYEEGKLYYMYQTGYYYGVYTQTLVQCDPVTGQTLQSMSIPGFTGFSNTMTKLPNSNDLIIAGDLHFTLNGDTYDDIVKVNTNTFTISPIQGVTNLSSNGYIKDLIIINPVDCQGGQSDSTYFAYVGGSFSTISGVSGFKSIARYYIHNGVWQLDQTYTPACYGVVMDLCYYNCQLVVAGSFTSSSSSGSTIARFTPKLVAFDNGQINPDFILSNTGGGLGGYAAWNGTIFNNLGQGWVRCMAIQPSNDGNNRWEIVVGGDFQNYLSNTNQTIISTPFMARYLGLNNYINSKWNYCLEEVTDSTYQISTTSLVPNDCQKWELFESNDLQYWTLLETASSEVFYDTTLVINKWYKLNRTVYNCGNSASSSYIFIKNGEVNAVVNHGAQLRSVVANHESLIVKEEMTNHFNVYPNPFNNSITVTDDYSNIKNIRLYNMLGERVFNQNYNANTIQIDLDYLINGVYLIVLTTDDGIEKKKIIKY